MDIAAMLSALTSQQRQKELATRDQMVLGEFVATLSAVPDKTLPIRFDTGDIPTKFGSWRGVYAELALGYLPHGFCMVDLVLSDAKASIGKTFTGYKGGDFVMGKHTPIWMANRGETGGNDQCYRGVSGIRIEADAVVIETELMDCI